MLTAARSLLIGVTIVPFSPAQGQRTSCSADAEFVISTVEQNYAGFRDKVTPLTRAAYDSATRQLRAQAAGVANDSASSGLVCGRALEQWTRFFRDGHLAISFQPAAFQRSPTAAPDMAPDTAPAALRARFARWPTHPVSEARVLQALAADSGRADPIQGIWKTVGASYRLAVVPDSTAAAPTFLAVVLQADSAWWVPGQVKAVLRRAPDAPVADTSSEAGATHRYSARYYLRNHAEELTTARLHDGLLVLADGSLWTREDPQSPGALGADAYLASLNHHTAVRALSTRTLLLSLPSFSTDSARAVDSVLRANAEAIRHTPNLIIDVRGNGGGSDYVFMPVLPLIVTGPVRSVNADIYATPLNTATFAAVLRDPRFPTADRPDVEQLVAAMRAHPGQFIPRADTVFRFDSLSREPEHVAVLMDSACASSCEEFVLAARQSRRVILVGTHTAGVLDYANVQAAMTPSGRFELHYGTSRSHRIPNDPVDPDGIAPQLPIPADVLFPVGWTQRWLEQHR